MPPGGWGHQNNLSLLIAALSPLWYLTCIYLWGPECTVYLPKCSQVLWQYTTSEHCLVRTLRTCILMSGCPLAAVIMDTQLGTERVDLLLHNMQPLGPPSRWQTSPPPSLSRLHRSWYHATTGTTMKMATITTKNTTTKIPTIKISLLVVVIDTMHKAEGYDIGFIQVSQLSIWSAVKPKK